MERGASCTLKGSRCGGSRESQVVSEWYDVEQGSTVWYEVEQGSAVFDERPSQELEVSAACRQIML